MSIKKVRINTYSNFLREIYFDTETADIAEVEYLLKKIKPYAANVLPFAPVFFAIDYSKRKYLFWSDNFNQFGGHKPEAMLEDGLEGTLDKLNLDYFKIFNEKLFPEILKNLKVLPDKETVVSFNHRMRNSNGKWMDVFQRCIYIKCPNTGLPRYCVGSGMDFSNYNSGKLIHQTIERFNSRDGKIQLISKKIYNPYTKEVPLTKQEKNILNLLVLGLNSKMIADKLKISTNTVNNHRQNILIKTNCNNVAELIAFAIDNCLITREI